MTKENAEVQTVDEARALFTHEPPSRRWLSSMARKAGAYVRIGRFLRNGGTLKGLQNARGWKAPRMPMKHYGHESGRR